MGLQLVAAESVDLVDNVLLAPAELQAFFRLLLT